MGKCKDCKDWTRDPKQSWELGEEELDEGYGRCLAAGNDKPMMARYDGGYGGELLTKGDFGCSEFRGK